MIEELVHVKTKNLNNCPKRNRYHQANAVARAVSFLIHHPSYPTAAFG
ncbi:MAG: hypothetical protein LUQ20_03885 [Candidatus Methanoperedens sp.]|nr:hypothetical protein [Candidatus Methanoperedens sp.]